MRHGDIEMIRFGDGGRPLSGIGGGTDTELVCAWSRADSNLATRSSNISIFLAFSVSRYIYILRQR